MTKMKKTIGLILVLSLLLSGCGSNGSVSETSTTEINSTEEITEGSKTVENKADTKESTEVSSDEESEEKNIEASDTEVQSILASMTLEEKVSQMIIPSIRRWDADNEVNEEDLTDGVLVEEKRGEPVTELNDETRSIIKDFSFGGVILFSENFVDTEQTVKLIADINEANKEGGNKTELFICADEEGGNVARLTSGTAFCGNMALAATDDISNVDTVAKLIGKELSAVGINVNFAPVSDVNNNPSNPVIGVRSFSDDPAVVADYVGAYIKGMQSENIMTASKHFPGHGNTEVDSHTGLPLINLTEEELEQVEFIPFESGIREGTDFLMTAHIQYPEIEKETYKSIADGSEIYLPATLSKEIITGILREKMGYEGLVVSDSLVMDAIRVNFDPMDAARYAINAGEDMILMPLYINTPDSVKALREYVDGIVKMVEEGEIDEKRIDESVTRILETKLKYGLLDGKTIADENIEQVVEKAVETVGSKSNHSTEWEITEKAVTMVKNEDDLIPLDSNGKSLLVCPSEGMINSLEFGVQKLKEDGIIDINSQIDVKCYVGLTPESAKDMVSGYENVVAVSELFNAAGLNPAGESGAAAAFIDSLIAETQTAGGKFVLISSRLPYDTARFQDADAILVAFGDRGMPEIPTSEGADSIYGPNIPVAVYTAFGGNEANGKMPVNIPKLKDDYTYSDEMLYNRGYGL